MRDRCALLKRGRNEEFEMTEGEGEIEEDGDEMERRSVRKSKRVIECVKKFGKVLLMRSVCDTTARRRS